MKTGDCFRRGHLLLRFCRELKNAGLYMFVAVNPNNGDIYGKALSKESLSYLKPMKTVIYDRIIKKLSK